MISLSCLAWLSVVMVQAVVHFFFFGKNDVVNEQPQQLQDPKSQPSSETDSGTSSPNSKNKAIHSDHSLKYNGQKLDADEQNIRDTALREEVQGQICPSESSPPSKSLQIQNRMESDVSMDSTCERSDSTNKTDIGGSSQNSFKTMGERYRPQSPTQCSNSSHNDSDNCSPAGENPNDCDCDSIQEDDEWRLKILKHYYEQGCSLSGSTAEYHETINMVCKRLQQQDRTLTNNVSATRARSNRGFYGMPTASIPCVSA
uniref:Uncharacterized protein n=1 Tax=Chaetoceros debilis TaxID=122233 RepID=A0A7S3PUZ7_9STRA|mmetsp:Transcript_21526/g.31749  ORF Transcript_21526/g.31749 Transcript_21526/m.31749 type:complete len:258 (+) Transcript_21526:147-920(+)